MKRIVLLSAALIGSALSVASPSMAQPAIQFGIGPDGRPQVGVTDPERKEPNVVNTGVSAARLKRLRPTSRVGGTPGAKSEGIVHTRAAAGTSPFRKRMSGAAR
jgi:hypothetical protein